MSSHTAAGQMFVAIEQAAHKKGAERLEETTRRTFGEGILVYS